jgi:hypothetical protein
MQNKTSVHQSALGSFGAALIVDRDGYTYTTAAGWMTANVDSIDGAPTREWALEQAAASRVALKLAQRELARWQQQAA